jgi:hypothetical protein
VHRCALKEPVVLAEQLDDPQGDFDAWSDLAADEWHTTATSLGIEPVYRGREG